MLTCAKVLHFLQDRAKTIQAMSATEVTVSQAMIHKNNMQILRDEVRCLIHVGEVIRGRGAPFSYSGFHTSD